MEKRRSPFDRMTVTVPEGEVDGLTVQRFEIKPGSVANFRLKMQGRGTKPGRYTKLVDYKTRTLWMSDTDAEKSDHFGPVQAIEKMQAERVLINGLGLGMVLAAALTFDHVQHVDVVEKEERVIKLVGPHYSSDPRVNIIHADAFEQMKAWPRGTRWDVGWSDIWADPSEDDLVEMARFNRSYGQRCKWHDCWAREELLRQRRAEARMMQEWWS